jgi:hypothetical protein
MATVKLQVFIRKVRRLNLCEATEPTVHGLLRQTLRIYTRRFIYDRDDLCVNKSQFVPVIFESPCIFHNATMFEKLMQKYISLDTI